MLETFVLPNTIKTALRQTKCDIKEAISMNICTIVSFPI